MPADADFNSALVLAGQWQEAKYTQFADYLKLRGQGQRAPALNALRDFVAVAQEWSFPERWILTARLLSQVAEFETPQIPLPHPLVTHLIRPTLKEALAAFPEAPEPAYWLAVEGVYVWESPFLEEQRELFWLREALRRDPTFQPARQLFLSVLIQRLAWHQHELPWGYLGEASEDLQAVMEGRHVLSGLTSSAAVQRWGRGLDEVERTIPAVSGVSGLWNSRIS